MYKVYLYENDKCGKEIYLHYFPDACHVGTKEDALRLVSSSSCVSVCINTFSRPAVSAKTFHRILQEESSRVSNCLLLGRDVYLGFLLSPNCIDLNKCCSHPFPLVYDPASPVFLPIKDVDDCETTGVSKKWKYATYGLIGAFLLLFFFWILTLILGKRKRNKLLQQCQKKQECKSYISLPTNSSSPSTKIEPIIPKRTIVSTSTSHSISPSISSPVPSSLNDSLSSILSSPVGLQYVEI